MDNIEENKVNSKKVVMTEAIAEKDFDRWIGIIRPPMRIVRNGEDTTQLDIIEKIVSGDLVVKEDGTVVLKLSDPLTGQRPIDSLEFRTRFKTHEIRKHVKRIEDGDRYGMLLAHACVLTGVEIQILNQFGKHDFNIISAIVSYFL